MLDIINDLINKYYNSLSDVMAIIENGNFNFLNVLSRFRSISNTLLLIKKSVANQCGKSMNEDLEHICNRYQKFKQAFGNNFKNNCVDESILKQMRKDYEVILSKIDEVRVNIFDQ